jgi:hypothetical protein
MLRPKPKSKTIEHKSQATKHKSKAKKKCTKHLELGAYLSFRFLAFLGCAYCIQNQVKLRSKIKKQLVAPNKAKL